MKGLKEKASEFLKQNSIQSTRVVVGVSGGVDSMVLLHVLSSLSGEHHLELHVVHVHHGIRGESADMDAVFVEEQSKNLGLPFTCVMAKLDPKETSKSGTESAARDVRYGSLSSIAESIDAKYIAIAHNADDVAETFLMNLARGSGVSGLRAHRESRECGSSTIIRPLHSVTRSDIETYAQKNEIQWREDETNIDGRFLRNRVRHEVMPVLKQVFGENFVMAVHRSSQLMNESWEAMESLIQPTVDSFMDSKEESLQGCISIPTSELESMHPSMVNEILRRTTRGLAKHPMSYDDTIRIKRLVLSDTGKKETLSQGLVATKLRGRIRVETTLNTRTRGN